MLGPTRWFLPGGLRCPDFGPEQAPECREGR